MYQCTKFSVYTNLQITQDRLTNQLKCEAIYPLLREGRQSSRDKSIKQIIIRQFESCQIADSHIYWQNNTTQTYHLFHDKAFYTLWPQLLIQSQNTLHFPHASSVNSNQWENSLHNLTSVAYPITEHLTFPSCIICKYEPMRKFFTYSDLSYYSNHRTPYNLSNALYQILIFTWTIYAIWVFMLHEPKILNQSHWCIKCS